MSDIYSYVDTLLSACIPSNNATETLTICKNQYNKICNFLDEDMLKGHQFILYKIISRCYENGISISWQYVEKLFSLNAKKFIRDKNVAIKELFPEVKVKDLIDLEKERDVIGKLQSLLQSKYEAYQTELVTPSDVNAALDILKETMKQESMKNILMHASKILFQGEDIPVNKRTEYLAGASDTIKYLLNEVNALNNKFTDGENSQNWFHIKSYEDIINMRNSDNRSYDFVTDTGIPLIDEVTGGIHTTQIFGLQGLPGVGKSRFASKLMYRAKVLYGKNVHYISMEQHCNELSMYFTSQHCWYKYGRYITDKQLKKYFIEIRRYTEEGLNLSAEDMVELQDTLPLDPDEIQIVNESELDLYSNPNYGEILYDNSYPSIEGFEAHIRNIHTNHMRIDLLCVDHMSILISDGSWNKGIKYNQTEIVTEGMKLLKRLAQRLNLAVIAINQMTREEINRLLEGKVSRITGSANSSEFERSSDVIMTLAETQQMVEAGKVFADFPKARDSGKPSRVMMDAKKGICVYEQSNTQAS